MSIKEEPNQRRSKYLKGLHNVSPEWQPLLSAVLRAVQETYGKRLRSLALFGSVARGTAKPTSDVDLMAVIDDLPRGIHARNEEFSSVRSRLRSQPEWDGFPAANGPPFVSAILFTPGELKDTPRIMLDMTEDAILILDDGTMEKKLDELLCRLRSLGSNRVFLEDGSWYWDLKPDLVPGEVFSL